MKVKQSFLWHVKNSFEVKSISNQKNEEEDIELPSTEVLHNAGKEVYSYKIGGFRVSILNTSRGLSYYISPVKQFIELEKRIKGRLEDVMLLLSKGNDLGDILSATLGINREMVADAAYIIRSSLGYGKLQVLIDDPNVIDISVEGKGNVWVRHSFIEEMRPEQDFAPTNIYINDINEAVSLQQTIATKCGTYVSTANPIVDTQLPQREGGHRVHLVFPTVSKGRPEIVVRKRLPVPPSISHLVESGVLPKWIAELFKIILTARGAVIIAGPPGSGKTTLIRSLLYSLVPSTWKVIVIEDTGEIDPPKGSPWTRYTTFELGSVEVGLFDLAKASLRASGTRLLVVGETRGREAQVLAQAMTVGLGGLCLPRDQLILARIDGKIDLYEIGEIVEGMLTGRHENVEVITWNGENRYGFSPISGAIIKNGSKKFIRVHSRGNVPHELHEDHLAIIYEKDRLIAKPAKELKPGDKLLTLQFKQNEKGCSYIRITDFLDKENLSKSLICLEKEGERSNGERKGKLAERGENEALDHGNSELFEEGHSIPLVIKLGKDLGYLIGLLLACGYTTKWKELDRSEIILDEKYCGSKALEKAKKALEGLGLEKASSFSFSNEGISMISVKFNIIASFLVRLTQNENGKDEKSIPLEIALRNTVDFREGLVEGYLEGKGFSCPGKIAVESRKQAEALYLLLRSLGFKAEVRWESYEKIVESDEEIDKAYELFIECEEDQANASSSNSNFHLSEIVKVESVEKDSLLYDIEVPGTHLYALGGGLILTHNTSFHCSSPQEVVSRLMAPPIELTPAQVSTFRFIAIMGFGDKPKRQLRLLAELSPIDGNKNVGIRTLWDREKDGSEISLNELMSRSKMVEELKCRLLNEDRHDDFNTRN